MDGRHPPAPRLPPPTGGPNPPPPPQSPAIVVDMDRRRTPAPRLATPTGSPNPPPTTPHFPPPPQSTDYQPYRYGAPPRPEPPTIAASGSRQQQFGAPPLPVEPRNQEARFPSGHIPPPFSVASPSPRAEHQHPHNNYQSLQTDSLILRPTGAWAPSQLDQEQQSSSSNCFSQYLQPLQFEVPHNFNLPTGNALLCQPTGAWPWAPSQVAQEHQFNSFNCFPQYPQPLQFEATHYFNLPASNSSILQPTGALAPSPLAPHHPTVAPQLGLPSVQEAQVGSSLLSVKQKRRHDSEVRLSKRTKVSKSINFIPMTDFVANHPLIEIFEFKAGSSRQPEGVGSIDPPDIVEKTPIGGLLADGYVQELSIAHDSGKSWGGEFEEYHMLASNEGPECVWICKEPEKEATDENIQKDFRQLYRNFLSKYVDENGRRPLYLAEFIYRIDKICEGNDLERAITIWVLRNHPFLVESVKWRVLIEDFYTFYKDVFHDDVKKRNLEITDLSKLICDRWHLEIVPQDNFLSLVYWRGNEHKRPADFFTRAPTDHRISDNDHKIYPYTSDDGFLAVFMRTFLVHGPDNARAINKQVRFSLKELELILAYYFEKFLPAFLGEIYRNDVKYELFRESIARYTNRKSSSWRASEKSCHGNPSEENR